jgi:hypothetical protein
MMIAAGVPPACSACEELACGWCEMPSKVLIVTACGEPACSGIEEGEDGEDPAVVGLRWWQVELGKDRRAVLADRLF